MRALPFLATAATWLVFLALAGAPARAQPGGERSKDLSPSDGPSKGVAPQLDSSLLELSVGWTDDPVGSQALAVSRGIAISEDRVRVSVLAEDPPAADQAQAAAPILGGQVTARFGRSLDAWIPIARLESFSRMPGISLVYRPVPAASLGGGASAIARAELVGTYLTQGVAASNANAWQAAGITGAGTSVAIVDSFQDADAAVTAGELPDPTYCFPDCESLDVSSPHGTACAEIVHDMAPGAEIVLASVATSTELAQRVAELAAADVDVVSVSLGFAEPAPGDGTGTMGSAIEEARAVHGTLYVGAGGNNATEHWDGTFSDADGDAFHQFTGTVEVNELGGGAPIAAGTPVGAYLRWDAWPTTDQDFDLYLYYWDGASWQIADYSINDQTGTQPPWEFVYIAAPVTAIYGLVIRKWSASTTPVFDLMVWSGHSLDVQVSARSLLEPATSSASLTAAAIDVGSFDLEDYSSHGPAHGPGGALSGGHELPRLAAFANVDTWSYGSGWFNGTSSATPHIAGAAALVRGVHPGWSPDEVQALLESRAQDQGAPGWDAQFGAGRLWLGDLPEHTLEVSRSGTGAGTVESDVPGIDCGLDCSESYVHATSVELVATPAAGSELASWSGAPDCADGEVTVTSDLSCVAVFELLPVPDPVLTMELSGSGLGVVSSSPEGILCGLDCQASYEPGAEVVLHGTPVVGSGLTSWGGDPDCADGVITLTEDRVCTAVFDVCPTESVVVLEDLVVSSSELASACNRLQVDGASVEVTASGELEIRAGNEVAITAGFAVAVGGRLSVIVGQPTG